jgi:methylated-DNA-[protein]-cysteine S-methyltransferase
VFTTAGEIMSRNRLPEDGEGSVAFDAGRLRLELRWRGGFMDRVFIRGLRSVRAGGAVVPQPRGLALPPWVVRAISEFRRFLERGGALPEAPLDLDALPEFQRRVLAELRRIPRGRVLSYSAVARAAGKPLAARAAARVLASNPWPLACPCHRVVAKDRTLRGFSAGGGVKTKQYLLSIEGVHCGPGGTVSREHLID